MSDPSRARGRDPSQDRPLNIVLLARTFPELSQTFVLDHAIQLLDGGDDVSIVGGRSSPGPQHEEVTEELIRDRVHYTDGIERLRRLTTAVELSRLLARSPTRWARLLTRTSPAAFERGQRIRFAAALSDLPEPDLYHSHFGPTGATLVEILRCLGYTTPVVTTFHGYDVTRVPSELGPDVYRGLFERGDLFLAVSQAWRRRLLELGAPEQRTLVQRVGVDSRRFLPVRRARDPRGGLRVLSVARLVEKKGITYALDAVADVSRSGIKLSYTIVGDGPLRSPLEEHARNLGLHGLVRFAGALPRQAVQAAMRDHDVLLAPSITSSTGDQEGVPVVLMEAMATAMPVISSWHSGIPELVKDGSSGLLTGEGDVDAIVEALTRLAHEPDLAERLGVRARRVIETDWDSRRLAEQLRGRYRALLEGRFT
jgi:colanic acid/amylovoran biosynthesis glycosyltransferase